MSTAEPDKPIAAHADAGTGPQGAARGCSGPVVSIVVVSYNTREMTLECLRSVDRETSELSYEVLFIDNRSTDGSWEAVEAEFGGDPRFVLSLSESNLGFAGANNELIKHARGEYILLLNPDTVVLDGAIERLVEFARAHPENGIWGGRTLFGDGSLNPTSCWGTYTLWSHFCRYSGLTWAMPGSTVFNPRGYGRWKRDRVREVGIVTGCFFLMKRDAWDHFGGFDREFFMYGEEADLCMRATNEGFRPIICPDATIIHHGGASEKILEDKMVRLLDAETRLLRRHWSPMVFVLGSLITRAGILLRAGAVSLCGRLGYERDLMWIRLWQRKHEWLKGFRSDGKG